MIGNGLSSYSCSIAEYRKVCGLIESGMTTEQIAIETGLHPFAISDCKWLYNEFIESRKRQAQYAPELTEDEYFKLGKELHEG